MPELMAATGMGRPWVYQRLRDLAASAARPGHAGQPRPMATLDDRPVIVYVYVSRASARKGAMTTMDEDKDRLLTATSETGAAPSRNGERKVVTTIYFSDPAHDTLHVGDARDVLAAMPDGSADCIVTSPPYWAKRDYGVAGQYGHEPDPAAYVATLRDRLRAKPAASWPTTGRAGSTSATPTRSAAPTASGLHAYVGAGLAGRQAPGMGAKNLLGLPWRVALALQDDGWILRNAIVWHKPNAMPESVRDRLNCRHELIFLLVKIPALLVRPRPDPRCRTPPRTARQPCVPARRHGRRAHPGDGMPGGSRPATATAAATRPPKYGPHTRQVIAARRYGSRPLQPGPPQRPQPRRRVVDPDPALPGPALRRLPDRRPARCIKAAASRAAWCSTRSAAPAPPASPPSRSAGSSPASNSTRPSPRLPPNGCGMPPSRSRRPDGGSRHDRHGKAARHRHPGRQRQNGLLPAGDISPAHPLPNRAPERTLAGPEQGRAAHAPDATSRRSTEDPSAWCCRTSRPTLTPAAARALLRVLLKAHASRAPRRRETAETDTATPKPDMEPASRRSGSRPGAGCPPRTARIPSPPAPGSTPAARR